MDAGRAQRTHEDPVPRTVGHNSERIFLAGPASFRSMTISSPVTDRHTSVGLADLPLTYALEGLCRRWSAREGLPVSSLAARASSGFRSPA
jgi:hypothetical protein